MAVITWPTSGRAFTLSQFDEGLAFDVQITIARAGNVITRMLPGWRWKAVLAIPDETLANRVDRQQLEALVVQLRGGANRLQMFNPAKVVRAGNLSGSPLVKTAAAIGASTIALKSCNGTVKRGDLLGLGGQRVMVVADASPVSSDMTVTFEPPLRVAVGVDTPVVWDKPTSQFVLTNPETLFPYAGTRFPGFSLELVEAW